MDFRWDDIRVFLALARHGTLAAAGGKVGLDASTVSRRLAGLEEAVGTTLFDRTRDGVGLTGAGEQLLGFAEELERSAIALTHAAESLEADPAGTVRVTAPPLMVDAYLALLVPELRRRFPRVRLELISSTSYADLTRREADLAIRGLRPQTGDLVSVRATTARNLVFAAPALAAELGEVSSLSALPWVTWSEDMAHLFNAKWVSEHAPGAEFIARTNSLGAMLALAAAGEAVVFTSTLAAKRYGLVPVRCAPPIQEALDRIELESLWLVGHRALRTVPRIAAVWAFLLEQMAQASAEVA